MSPQNRRLTTTIPIAARIIGVSTTTAYLAAKVGELIPGVPVLRVGRRLVVPVANLERVLGVTLSAADLADDCADASA